MKRAGAERPAGRGGRGPSARLLLLLGSARSGHLAADRAGCALERRAAQTRGASAALTEAERVELVRRIEELRSRARVVRVARERLGMHLPSDDEIVFLPVPRRGRRRRGVQP